MSPIIPFSVVYLLVLIAFCWWMIRFNTRRMARKEQQMREWERTELAEMIAEQERIDAAAHRLLANVDTMPPFPALPPVIPAHYLDASDMSDATTTYCPVCALERVRVSNLRDDDGYYPLPRGQRVLCGEHTARWERALDGDVQ